jgi:hypothetical protein
MIPIVTAKEMQSLDSKTIDGMGVPGLVFHVPSHALV